MDISIVVGAIGILVLVLYLGFLYFEVKNLKSEIRKTASELRELFLKRKEILVESGVEVKASPPESLAGLLNFGKETRELLAERISEMPEERKTRALKIEEEIGKKAMELDFLLAVYEEKTTGFPNGMLTDLMGIEKTLV